MSERTTAERRAKTLERAMRLFNVDDSGCWIWTGSISPAGYGRIGGWYAHRLLYEESVGPIPDGFDLDHPCRVTRCVNPGHMEAVSHRENCLRGVGVAAQCAAKTHCIRGHELSGDNLVSLRTRPTRRICIHCARLRGNRAYHRLMASGDTERIARRRERCRINSLRYAERMRGRRSEPVAPTSPSTSITS